ncbi:class I SAM-dependent methyltransferase [Hoyosella sp. G463]|uniref:Class I SAM-dependent methyltransferase n=1 Tax=Lolliginicoccus lacisalsi TaxID=2742202 RepID=A0A927JDT9_9ACTN|nr:class I SAM-dependent methyltransferase [Lolliginicoccus lacisalsi]MBD8507196.1 class I SAM-dependent methyltransferase [Lolliginicoccus lacisalsi]
MRALNKTTTGSPATLRLPDLLRVPELETLSIAEVVGAVLGDDLPVRFTAYDGSAHGPEEAQHVMHLRSPRGLRYLASAPGDLGMARAYVSGDLVITGAHPGDPYTLMKVLTKEVTVRRPSPVELATIVRSLGWQNLRPIAPPPQEHQPRWRRIAQGLLHSRARDAAAIQHHYDVSNEFYQHVLGPSMTYTCATYATEDTSLEDAQEAKYALVHDKLGLREGDRLLDVGCGWGGMARYAAKRGVTVIGATLSRQQAEWAQDAIAREGLEDRAEVRFSDYRDIPESGFDAISSIGLTEHIGVRNYQSYFRFLHSKLRPGGRLLNHCITRPSNRISEHAGEFIDRYVFPDAELAAPGRLINEIHDAGFEVRHEENLREHYALTLRDWNANLARHWDECVAASDEGTARVWGLYIAGSRVAFEKNSIQLHQILAVKPTSSGDAQVPLRPWWSR